MTTTIETVRANLEQRSALVQEFRAIGSKAEITPADEQRGLEIQAECDAIDARVRTMLEQEQRSGTQRDALGDLVDAIPDRGPQADNAARRVGAITPVQFRSEQYQELYEAFMRNQPGQIETRAVSAYPAFGTQSRNVVNVRREPTRMAALMPTQPITNGSVTYYRQSASATAAATVAVAAAKPESTPGWTAVPETARKIAHYTDVPTEALADFENFQAIVDAEMRAGVIHEENAQIISGDGTGTNLTGLLATSGIQTYAPVAAEARYLSILHAMTMLRVGDEFIDADAIALNPEDWEIVLTTTSDQGDHIVQTDVTGASPRSLWGVRVVLTTGIDAGTALVANLAEGTVVFEREPVRVMVDPYSQSKNNLVRFIAEERLALGVTRPDALVEVTFNGTA